MISSLDEIDLKILNILQEEGKISNQDLAKKVHLSPSAVLSRVKRIEKEYLKKYVGIFDREKLGFDLLCIIQLNLVSHQGKDIEKFRNAVLAMEEVQSFYTVTGDYDYILKVVLRSRKHLEEFMIHKLANVPVLGRYNTTVVIEELKSVTAVPL